MKPDPSRWIPIGPEVGPMVLLAAFVSAMLASVVLLFAGLPWALFGTLLLGAVFLGRRRLRDRRWMQAAAVALAVQVAVVVVMFIAQTR